MTQDWICSVKWVQVTPASGAWLWLLWLVDEVDGKPSVREPKIGSGVALTKLGVYWRVWRLCREHGLRFRPNVRGTFE